jgi:hypothetical protein
MLIHILKIPLEMLLMMCVHNLNAAYSQDRAAAPGAKTSLE